MTPAALDTVDRRSLRSAFLARAAAQPDAPALVVGGVTLTYGELAHRARVLAAAITQNVNRPVERVGVFAARSEVAYAATLAALCSGGAFVPLNRKFPAERTRSMVRRALLDAIVVDRASAPLLNAVLEGLDGPSVVILAEPDTHIDAPAGCRVIDATRLATLAPLDRLPPVMPDDLAYLLFTSGTTGEPKGVGITHANVLHYLDVMAERYQLTPNDRCSQTFDQTFDLAVHDLFMTWNAGACLYAMEAKEMLAPARFIAKHALTTWFAVPSAAGLANDRLSPGSLPSLRWILFCGEPLSAATAARWQAAAPDAVVENLYGPTELTIACLAYRWDGARSPREWVNGIVSIGRPLPGLGALVVDEALTPVENGQTGELLICGPQTAPGYWCDPQQTAERFIEIAVSDTRRKRFYRTGDLVARQPAGTYSYIGRIDHQIKVLGFRVEPAEIEAALRRHAGVTGAVALGWPVEDGRALGVVAFVTGTVDSVSTMLTAIATTLPAYMVPKRVVPLEQFPLNANGKVDRAQLRLWLAAESGPDAQSVLSLAPHRRPLTKA